MCEGEFCFLCEERDQPGNDNGPVRFLSYGEFIRLVDRCAVSVRIRRPATRDWAQETLEVLDEIRHPDTFPLIWLSTLGLAACGAVTRHAIPELS
jgi:hypothetical protein